MRHAQVERVAVGGVGARDGEIDFELARAEVLRESAHAVAAVAGRQQDIPVVSGFDGDVGGRRGG
jgi:phosphohistidine swiveling domain-containing protein